MEGGGEVGVVALGRFLEAVDVFVGGDFVVEGFEGDAREGCNIFGAQG